MKKIVFRREKDGNILAVFGEKFTPYTLAGYCHIGQHCAVGVQYYQNETVPATAGEYKNLLSELKNIGYNDLKIYKRLPISKIFR